MFISLGGKSVGLTINQIWWRDSRALHSGLWVSLSCRFAIFIHQPHLFTADLHRRIATSEVPRGIFIFQDQQRKQRTLFFRNWWAPFWVHQFWIWRSRETERWSPLSAAALPLDNTEGKFISLQPGLELWSLHPCREFRRLSGNPWDQGHQSSSVLRVANTCQWPCL